MGIRISGYHKHSEFIVKINLLISDSDHDSTPNFDNLFIKKRIHYGIHFLDISDKYGKTKSETFLQNFQKIIVLKIGLFNISVFEIG